MRYSRARRRLTAAPAATTSAVCALLAAVGREPVRGAMDVDRRNRVTAWVAHGRRDGVDAFRVLLEPPSVAAPRDVLEPCAQLLRVNDGLRSQRGEAVRHVCGDGVARPVGKEHEARRHGVERRACSGPVANLDRVVALDLDHVVDVVAVGQAEARVLSERRDEPLELRPRERDEAPLERRAPRQRLDAGTDPPAAAVQALHGAERFERREEPRDGALRQVKALGKRGHAGRPVCDRREDRERPL